MTMTLEQVRDELRRPWNQTSAFAWCAQLADAIDAHLSQHQPVAQGEAVSRSEVLTEYEYTLFLDPDGTEKIPLTLGMTVDANGRKEAFLHPTSLDTTIPTGHGVVPDGLEKDAARYQWLRDRLCVRWEMALDGEKHEALGMRPGFGFLMSTMDPANGWTLPEFFDDHRKKTDNAIDKAMLAAAPDAGGV